MNSLRVTVVGAGNLGLACSARMAANGMAVTLLTGNPGRWTNGVAVEDCNGDYIEGPIAVTSNEECIAETDLVLLCVPGNVMKDKLARIAPYLQRTTPVASVFAGDGFFFIIEEVLGAAWPALGFQRVPFIARTKIPYRVGGITGYKKELFLGHRNVPDPNSWRKVFENAFGTSTALLENFYEAAFVSSNAVLHPARLMSLKMKIDKNGPFGRNPLFYEEWDNVASDWAIRLDEELRYVASTKGANVQPLLEYYESHDVASLTEKIRNIQAFKGILSPLSPAGCIDYSHRYVVSDIKTSLRYILREAKSDASRLCGIRAILDAFSGC